VILSLQLPFAVIPLIYFTSDRHKMGSFANRPWVNVLAWTIAIVIIYLNMRLAMGQIIEWLSTGPVWIWPVLIVSVAGLAGLLIYLVARFFMPARAAWTEPRSRISESVAANLRAMRVSRVGAAIEHSAGDAAIISAALSMARAEKAELILIHVVNTPGAAVYGSESGSLHHSADAQYLDDLARELRDGDVLVDTELRFGNTVTELVRTVKEAGLGLLVMGSHGHAGLSDLIHGRTATVVQHRVDIPVLIVKSGAPESAIHPQLPDESTHK
jgi:manganese transport protein